MSIFFEEILKFTELDTDTESSNNKGKTVSFVYDGLYGNAEQNGQEVPVSRILFQFSYPKSKNVTKNQVMEHINEFNLKIALLKGSLKKFNSQEIQFLISLEYNVKDESFKEIPLETHLKLITAGGMFFKEMLNGNKPFDKDN